MLYRWVLQFGHLGYPQFVHGSTETFIPLLPQMHWESGKLYISACRPTLKPRDGSRAYHSRISTSRLLVFWEEGARERAAARSMAVGTPRRGRRHCLGFLGTSKGSPWAETAGWVQACEFPNVQGTGLFGLNVGTYPCSITLETRRPIRYPDVCLVA